MVLIVLSLALMLTACDNGLQAEIDKLKEQIAKEVEEERTKVKVKVYKK